MIEDIDVSHWNGAVDWHKVAASGKKFAYLKATENDSTDPTFQHNRDGAHTAGLFVGAYHFYHFDGSWSDQARHFITIVGALRTGELPPVLDLEQQSYRDGNTGVSKADGARQALSWLGAIKAHYGVTPIVYCDRDFALNFLQNTGFAAFPLWLAAYNAEMPAAPHPWKSIAIWQYNEHGTVAGIADKGSVDLDRFTGTLAQLQALAKP